MPSAFSCRRAGIQGREQAAGGLLKAAVRIGFQLADIAGEIQRWFTAEQQLALQRLRAKPRLCAAGGCQLSRLQHCAAVDGLCRVRRTHADFPLFLQRGEGFARQAQAADGGINLTIAEARQRAHWYKQRAARPGASCTGGS